MEEFIQNGGLFHLAEAIFSCLPDKELVKCLTSIKTVAFIPLIFGRSVGSKSLTGLLATNINL